jgi:DNA (cytosine-5)-methyltransferase 1
MNENIDIIDLFSGYGGFSEGFEQAGFKLNNHYFSEIDAHAIANYKFNFPHAKYLGSITEQSFWDIPRTGNSLIITFGSPCQDFSLAGRREGLTGAKSSLIEYAFMVIERLQPDFFIWENVKGFFSSNVGEDFWAVIQAFTKLGPYRLEWELVNSSWFIPQNRERVYVVGHLAVANRGFREVFPIGESDSGFIEGALNTLVVKKNEVIQLNPSTESQGVQPYQQNRVYDANGISPCLDQGAGRWSIKPALNSELGRTNNIQVGTLRTYKDGQGMREMKSNVAPTLFARAREDGRGQPVIKITQVKPVLTPDRAEKRQNGRRIKEDGEPAFTLTAQDKHGVEISNGEQVAIRRLTEIECERLQGLKDNWTKWGMYENKKTGVLELREISSAQRYKICGNGVTVDVVREIAKKLYNNMNAHLNITALKQQ